MAKKRKYAKNTLFGKPTGSIVKHPGAVKEAAKRDGLSTHEEAVKESHSPNKKIADRGRLALRFEGRAKHGNLKRPKKHGKKKTAIKR